MQIGKVRTTEELSRHWEDKEWRFKRPQETLYRKELSFQVPRQVILRRKPKNDKDRRNWTPEAQQNAPRACNCKTMRLGHLKCA